MWEIFEGDDGVVFKSELLSAGFDSVKITEPDMHEGGSVESLVMLDESKIRSVNAAFDPAYSASPELLLSMSPDPVGFNPPVQKWLDKRIVTFQDKFHQVKLVQREIEKADGTITDETNPYLAEEAFYGKTEEQLRLAKEAYTQPLIETLNKHDISLDDFD